jgi:hypothetical protein
MIKVGVFVIGKLFYPSQIYLIQTVADPEAIFLVVYDPSMNEL